MIEGLSFLVLLFVFVFITMIFSLTYYKKVLFAKREYVTAKGFVSGIVLTFKGRLEKQGEKIDIASYEIEGIQSSLEKSENQNRILQRRMDDLTRKLTSVFAVNKRAVNAIVSMGKKVNELKASDDELYKKIEAIEGRYQEVIQKPELRERSEQGPTSMRLTNTERQIIQVILSEGAKTPPEIEERIGKTREHTSRLMKKLWMEGYVERDTHTIPFTYRPTKELEKMLNAQV